MILSSIFLLFLLAHLARKLIRRDGETVEDTLLLLVNPFTFFATTYYLFNSTHHDWMGPFAIVMAFVYAGAAKLLMARAPKSRREILLLIAVALTFVTIEDIPFVPLYWPCRSLCGGTGACPSGGFGQV